MTININYSKNIISAYIGQFIILIGQFIVRNIFVTTLGSEYLGLNGLFGNILTILSLSELGIGQAIIYSLYKPIVQNDEAKILSIMHLFKKMYILIGIFISVVGIALTPFLGFFVKEMPNIKNISLIYVLFVLSTSISYFFSYKSAFFIANQKNYVSTINHYLWKVIALFLQATSLLYYQNYIVYLCINLGSITFENIAISYLANHSYPFLKKKSAFPLDKKISGTIKANTKALLIHKIGAVIVFHTDNLLLSKFFGLVVVGLYSNYSLIFNSLDMILSKLFESLTSTVGHIRIIENKDKQIEIFYKIQFLTFFIYGITAISLYSILQLFITFWIGEQYLLSKQIAVVLIINFFITGMRKPAMMFNDAYGLHRYYKWMPIGECLTNLTFSILLSMHLGPIGIFVGTTISSVAFPVLTEPTILFRRGFRCNGIPSYYLKQYIQYLVTILIALFTCTIFNRIITINNLFFHILILFIGNCLIFVFITILLFWRSLEFQFLFKKLVSFFR